jgi:hypothetical protein
MVRKSEFEPRIGASRSSAPDETGAEPMTSGETRSTCGIRNTACASASVRSRGVSPLSMPGAMPPVSERPGMTMTRRVPSRWNSPETYSRAPSPSEVSATTAATPIVMASSSMKLRIRARSAESVAIRIRSRNLMSAES